MCCGLFSFRNDDLRVVRGDVQQEGVATRGHLRGHPRSGRPGAALLQPLHIHPHHTRPQHTGNNNNKYSSLFSAHV